MLLLQPIEIHIYMQLAMALTLWFLGTILELKEPLDLKKTSLKIGCIIFVLERIFKK